MLSGKLLINILLLLTIFSLALPYSAYAYLDAGTGSYIIQVLIGLFVGGLYMVKLFWRRIKDFFRNLF